MPITQSHVSKSGGLRASRRYIVGRLAVRPKSLHRAVRYTDAQSAIGRYFIVHIGCGITSARSVLQWSWKKVNRRILICTVLLSVLAGHRRYAHITALPLRSG